MVQRERQRGRRSRWDDALTLLAQKLADASARRGERGVPQPARDGQLPRVPRRVARRLRHAAAPQRRLRGRRTRRSQANRRRTASRGRRSTSRTRSSSSRSAPTSSTTWGASVPQQLDFADARAKLDGAPRFVYIGPRRSLTGLNADEWIACKPGSELAIANALAGRGGRSPMRRRRAASMQAVLQRLANELAATKPALVLVRRHDGERARRRARRRRAQPGGGRRRRHDQAGRGAHVRSTGGIA